MPLLHFLKVHFNIISHLQLGLPSDLVPSDLSAKTLYGPLLSPTIANGLQSLNGLVIHVTVLAGIG